MTQHLKTVAPIRLAKETEPCCVLDLSLQFTYCNPAWDDFARANGGNGSACGRSVTGRRLLHFIPAPLKPFFMTHLSALRNGRGIWSHEYECSSLTEFRIYELQALFVQDDNEILISHGLKLRTPHNRIVVAPPPAPEYDGVRMCCHCRHTRRLDGSGWDWIPAYLAAPPENRVDDLCPRCTEYYQRGEQIGADWQ